PLHHLRPGGGVPVPVGGVPRRDRHVRLLVDDDLPRDPDHRFRVRVEEGRVGMGVERTDLVVGQSSPTGPTPFQPTAGATLPPGPEQNALLRGVTNELQDKGFIVASAEKLVNWARTGS